MMTQESRKRALVRGLVAVAMAIGARASERASFAQAEGMPLQKFEDVVKGMQASPGMITFYRYTDEDATKDHSKLLAVIPKALLNVDLMLVCTNSRGSNFGYPIGDGLLVRWQQSGNRVMLMAPDTTRKHGGSDPVAEAVRNTYTDSIIGGFPVMATDASGGMLIDLGSMIYSNISGVAISPNVRRDLSQLVKVKSFPENTLVDVDIVDMMDGSTPSSVGVTYAFRKLPPLGTYTPRLADERVGYFTTVVQDWGAKYTDHENLTRYVNRWNIKKLDPSIEMSPPEKPIIFIVEKTVPIQFRKYVADGIAEWNKAFEKVGITQAIVVQQQTDDNEYAAVDPEDARYNFIRWIVTGRGFAMGPSRPDPRTGQLLDADIIFDDSMVRFYMSDNDIVGPHSLSSQLGEGVVDFYRQNPAFIPAGTELSAADQELLRPAPVASGQAESTSALARWRRGSMSQRQCSIGNGMRQQFAVAQMAEAAAGGKKLPDRIIGEMVKDTVCHEVGHTLGLRHNFKGSAWLSVDEIKKRRDTGDEATWSSVMDYNPYLYFPGDKIESVRHLSSPTIGPYDYWAIEYGYATPTGGQSETDLTGAIAGKTNTRELAYATDEDVDGFASPDPAVNLWDMGSDPVAWAKMRMELADELLKGIKTWGIKKDEPNYYVRQAFQRLMSERVSYAPYVAREVTGLSESRSRAGDANAPAAFTLLEPKAQRDALKFLGDTIFSEAFFDIDPALLNALGASRWSDWASNPVSRTDYPVHGAVLSMQAGTLATLTNGAALSRVYDAEMKSKAEDKFTAAELIRSLRDMIWSDLDASGRFTDSKPMIGSFRRNLQQQYLQNVLSLAEIKPYSSLSPDLQNMLRFSLRELSARIGKAESAGERIDFASRAHLSEAKVKIDRVLDAPYVTGGGGGGQIIILSGRDAGKNGQRGDGQK